MLNVLRVHRSPFALLPQRSWPEWALAYLHVFRVVVVGGCVALMAVAWLGHVQWLLMASVCIAVGEFLECTYYISVLKWAEHSGRLQPRSGTGRGSSGQPSSLAITLVGAVPTHRPTPSDLRSANGF